MLVACCCLLGAKAATNNPFVVVVFGGSSTTPGSQNFKLSVRARPIEIPLEYATSIIGATVVVIECVLEVRPGRFRDAIERSVVL